MDDMITPPDVQKMKKNVISHVFKYSSILFLIIMAVLNAFNANPRDYNTFSPDNTLEQTKRTIVTMNLMFSLFFVISFISYLIVDSKNIPSLFIKYIVIGLASLGILSGISLISREVAINSKNVSPEERQKSLDTNASNQEESRNLLAMIFTIFLVFTTLLVFTNVDNALDQVKDLVNSAIRMIKFK